MIGLARRPALVVYILASGACVTPDPPATSRTERDRADQKRLARLEADIRQRNANPPTRQIQVPTSAHEEGVLGPLRQEEANARRFRGAPKEAVQFASAVAQACGQESVRSGLVNIDAFLLSASEALEEAMKLSPGESPELLTTKAWLLFAAGRPVEAKAALQGSLDTRPTLKATLMSLTLLDAEGNISAMVPLCKRSLPELDPEEKVVLLDAALMHMHAISIEGGLGWAAKEDRDLYRAALRARREQEKRKLEIKAAREEQRRRDAEQKRERAEEIQEARRAEADAKFLEQMSAAGSAIARAIGGKSSQCASQCRASASFCRSKCFGDFGCASECSDGASECEEGCPR